MSLAEIRQAAVDVIAAIEDGDIEIAKARLRVILAVTEGLDETTGCPASECRRQG